MLDKTRALVYAIGAVLVMHQVVTKDELSAYLLVVDAALILAIANVPTVKQWLVNLRSENSGTRSE